MSTCRCWSHQHLGVVQEVTLGGEMGEGMEDGQGGTEESRTDQLKSVDVINGPLPRVFQAINSSSMPHKLQRLFQLYFLV
jgi:hypothetical protein